MAIKFFCDVLISISATYFLLISIKWISYRKIKPFLGVHKHYNNGVIIDNKIFFLVKFKWLNFISPIPTIAIEIERKSLDGITQSDWQGIYVSDILNPFYFKGTYIIKDDYIKRNIDGDQDGWHELNFFNSKPYRIGLTLHYIKDNKWINEDGYVIAKYN